MASQLTTTQPLGQKITLLATTGELDVTLESTGGPGGVTTFNGRTGAVVPLAGDYAASQITNDSTVAGATVAAALNTLLATVVPIGTANTVLTSNGVANTFAQVTDAFVSPTAAIAVTKLAAGAANTVLTSNGTTNAFAQITNAFVSPTAAILVSKLAASGTNGQAIITIAGVPTWSTTFVDQRVSTTGAIVAGSNTAPVETAGSIVSVGDGTVGGFLAARVYSNTATDVAVHTSRRARGTESVPLVVVNGDAIGRYNFTGYDGAAFISGARITATVDAVPASGSVPMALAVQTMPAGGALTTRLSINSAGNCAMPVSLALGPSTTTQPATAGELRFPYAFAANVRSRSDTSNYNIVTFSTVISGGSTDEMLFGDLATGFVATRIAGSSLVAFHAGTGPVANGNQRMSISTTTLSVGVANLTWITTATAANITQTAATSANSTGSTMLVQAQGIGAGSSGTTAGGPLNVFAGDDIAGGTNNTGGKLSLRGGNASGGTNNTGGALDIGPGSGATAGGVFRVLNGAGTARMTVNDTGLAFFAAAAVAQQTLTDNTTGTPATQLVDVTTAAVADPVKVNNNFASIRQVLNRYGLAA